MDRKDPIRLNKEPLIEAVWEIRFISEKPSFADLLPGLIFKELPNKYPNIVRLPAADFPAPILEQDPNLKYAPKIRMEDANHSVQIGEHVVSLSCSRPYSGWEKFSTDIRTLIDVVSNTKLIARLERCSLKYIDLIDLSETPSLKCLNVKLKLGAQDIDIQPLQLRTEIKENGLTHTIQIVSPAEVTLPGESKRLRGVIVDIDTIKFIKESESWDKVNDFLDLAHSASKSIFFNILKAETIEKLKPEYEE